MMAWRKLNKINTFLNDFNIKELEGQQENVQEKTRGARTNS